jgi:tRNA (cytidine32/uridine32-2'-O)-methyltransferase
MTQLDNIRIILINTITPGNIGASARAMKNMGLTNLYLVNPQQFPDEKATWRAAHATDILENAKIYTSLNAAVADCHLVIGTSARTRYLATSVVNAQTAASTIVKSSSSHKIALVFGREDRGLTNDELQQCHLHLSIPSSDYSSLNLAAAVQVVCYEIFKASGEQTTDSITEPEYDLAPQEQINHLLTHFETTLIDLNFYNPQIPKQMLSRLRRMYMRIRLDTFEVGILRGILAATDRLIAKIK